MKIAVIALLVPTMVAAIVAKQNKQQPKQQPKPQPKPQPVVKQPNIILLITDDQDVLLGSTTFMPNYQKLLVEQGTTFKNYFVHTPVCCSSRSTIYTGKYIHNGGAINNSLSGNCDGPDWIANNEKFTAAVYAQQAGYRTSFAGKYLNTYGTGGSNTVPPGWDKWFGAALGGFNTYYYNYSVSRMTGSRLQQLLTAMTMPRITLRIWWQIALST
jgi:arylsulfatase A-like enzyme